MSTGVNEGLIEVVGKAETVCKIQMRHADQTAMKLKTTAALKKGAFLLNFICQLHREENFFVNFTNFFLGLILAWLKHHNPNTEGMKKAQEEFTKSCAGYSVATYILGMFITISAEKQILFISHK